MKRTCIQCGKEFELTNSEIGFYKKRKLSLPKRCKECREQNRQEKGTSGKSKSAGQKVKTTQSAAAGQNQAKAPVQTKPETPVNTVKKGSKKSKLTAAAAIVAAVIYFGVTGTWPGADTAQIPQNAVEQNAPAEVYTFRTQQQLEDHYEKHGYEMGFASADEYLEAANLVIASDEALHKIEAEDGDDIYFIEDTNEFVVLSTDDYIRTYFQPEDGIEYYERQ